MMRMKSINQDEEADEERESLVTNIPEQTILVSLMEGKTPHQKCDECSIPKEKSEAIAAIAETTEEDANKVSTLFVSQDLSAEEKELCEEKRNQKRSKVILHLENKSNTQCNLNASRSNALGHSLNTVQ